MVPRPRAQWARDFLIGEAIMKKTFLYTIFPVLLALFGIGSVVGNPFVDDNKEKEVSVILDEASTPVMMSIVSMYAPAPLEYMDTWMDSACFGMTADGCQYFKDNQALNLWEIGRDTIGSSSNEAYLVEQIDETSQLWRVRVTTFYGGGNSETNETAFDIFALVRRGEDHKWYLNRVISGRGIYP